ncbi:hypothetical protein MNEG_14221 [Monoraphidium neglectum]|jgi:tRNA acetyltransferase TAN1|uniref:THUMP domain-containing protein n=1 Tax=Monoraphidium neglectum TaxID=145388 RepID=A0A0D2J126_9CHLO|nr:hypothetical protein MNEG_14221 [Monoraphidium neglectum]KIY93742.1 hypothetical protein MNEG_14221 [Monoraphidium neglectum]|eukprot:XP_013892762.1 hypothetical protein MNEG_14221 [Monoraphidium neglectum]
MERRACSGLDHMQVVDAFAKAVPPPHKVNLGKPDATILVQLVRNVCAVAVAPRYKALCKYNVRVAAEPDEEGDAGKDGAGKQQEQQPQKPEQQQQQEQEGAEAAAGEEPAAVKDAAGEPAGGAAEGEVAAGGGEEAAG